jgi:hypothetical protein
MGRIDSAIASRQRPSAALLELGDPYGSWQPIDWHLQEAVHVLNRQICKRCGNPIWYCHSADNRIDFEVKVGVCYAEAEIEDHKKTDRRELGAGEYYYAVAVGLDNGKDMPRDPLPSREEAMRKME